MTPPSEHAQTEHPFADMTLGEFLDATAAKLPTPGGGSVAAVVGALAAALGQMVVNYSLGRKSLAEHDPMLADALATLESARKKLLALADEDARCYAVLNELWKLNKDDDRRRRKWSAALDNAIAAPHLVMDTCDGVLTVLESLCGRSNAMLRSDLAIAADFASAGIRAAAWNVRVNLGMLEDRRRAEELGRETDKAVESSRHRADLVCQRCETGW